MSILDHRKIGLEALYTDLQRMAARTAAPGCTIDRVRHVLQDLGGGRYSRSEMALKTLVAWVFIIVSLTTIS